MQTKGQKVSGDEFSMNSQCTVLWQTGFTVFWTLQTKTKWRWLYLSAQHDQVSDGIVFSFLIPLLLHLEAWE